VTVMGNLVDSLRGTEVSGTPRAAGPSTAASDRADTRASITEKTDEEIFALAKPLWRELVKYSNEGKYGEFTRNFSSALALAMDQVAVGHQFANSELARNLAEDADCLGIIRRGEHVTVLYRQRSTKKPGEWLGRLVLGYEDGQVRIFGASIF
jgi:hypothetical protein